jgi:hypothetical protein
MSGRKKSPCKSRVVGLMHTRCQRGSTDFDCDPMDYCRMKSMDEVDGVERADGEDQ